MAKQRRWTLDKLPHIFCAAPHCSRQPNILAQWRSCKIIKYNMAKIALGCKQSFRNNAVALFILPNCDCLLISTIGFLFGNESHTDKHLYYTLVFSLHCVLSFRHHHMREKGKKRRRKTQCIFQPEKRMWWKCTMMMIHACNGSGIPNEWLRCVSLQTRVKIQHQTVTHGF